MSDGLGIGMLGSGFMARFHLEALKSVRGAHLVAVHSPTPAHREELAAAANRAGIGPCRAAPSVEEVACDPQVDALWIVGPNDTRVEHMRTIHDLVSGGQARLRAVACEKPLGRTVAEAREMLALAEGAGVVHGYLENQVFAPAVCRGKEVLWRRGASSTGRPYLARASEEHGGPHRPWFWQGWRQGGGALMDMMCHSVEVARELLTDPARDHSSLRTVAATGRTAVLKWGRPEYAALLAERTGHEVDLVRNPVEDVASGTVELEDDSGMPLMMQCTTAWAFVGPGLRIRVEVLGPEYGLEFDTLATSLRVFLSRGVSGRAGEDLVEKQNAEQGLMPILEDEAFTYGYVHEDRHMVRAFIEGRAPRETFRDGLAVTEILMALYRSAETGATVVLPAAGLDTFVPRAARTPREAHP